MPWLETDPMDQRLRFIHDDQSDLYDRSELGARYGSSRKAGYKWLARYLQCGGSFSSSRRSSRGARASALAPGMRLMLAPQPIAQPIETIASRMGRKNFAFASLATARPSSSLRLEPESQCARD